MRLHFNDVANTILDIKKDTRTEVFNFGLDNAYPSLIDTLVHNSVTSKSCVDKVARSIYGKSFGEAGMIVINDRGQTLNEVLRIASREFAKYDNLYIWVGYNADFKIDQIKVVPTKYVRVGKDDDKGYSGKFIVYDNWDKTKHRRIMSEQFKIVDRYNPIKKVIESQIEKAGSIKEYRGQIMQIQRETYDVYSKSPLHAVMNDALLEYNASTFRSRGGEKGFLNAKLLITKPMGTDEERSQFKRGLENVQGAENSGRVFWMEVENTTDKIDEEFKLEDLTSDFDDELFRYSEEQARKNIALAFGVPLGLVDVSDSSLFGNSGALIKEMKKILWEAREEDRDMIEETFRKLLGKWKEPIENELEIISPFEDEPVPPQAPEQPEDNEEELDQDEQQETEETPTI